jgi:CO/xanthine dehydrogenase Mo-binding subunit
MERPAPRRKSDPRAGVGDAPAHARGTLNLEGLAVYSNKTNCGSYRAPSGPQANFAVESQMDLIADALGIDPLDFDSRTSCATATRGRRGRCSAPSD